MMKIIILSLNNFLKVQGATEPYYVYRYLSKRHEILAFFPTDRSTNYKVNKSIYEIPKISFLPVFLSYNLLTMFFLSKKEVRDADLIYSYKGIFTPVMILKFLGRKKLVLDFRSSPIAQEIEFKQYVKELSFPRLVSYKVGKFLYKYILQLADLVLAISEEVKEELIIQYGVSPHKIHVQPLGVDFEEFRPRQKKSIEKSTELRLIYIGSIAAYRGIDTLIDVLSILKSKKIPVKLIIVGGDEEKQVKKIQQRAIEKGVANMVDWKGYVPHSEIPKILDDCDIALSPLPPLEAYKVSSPAKIFEYLAMNLVVIATDILAHRKIIKDGWNGIMVPPNNPEALANKIEQVYQDEGLREFLRENSRNSVRDYNWEIQLRKLERKLKTLVEHKIS